MAAIHLACSTDERYAPHCAAMLHSALARHPAGTLAVHFLHAPTLPVRIRSRMSCIVHSGGGTLTFHEVRDSMIRGLPGVARIPALMWYRVFLPEILGDLGRVLYLDADTLVVDRLDPLWSTDLEGFYLGAVTNVFEERMRGWPLTLGLRSVGSYFNSGVLLMNLEALRRDGCSAAIRDYGTRQGQRLIFPDQDALNAVLAPRRRPLHPRWNCMNCLPFYPDSAAFFPPGEVEEALRAPGILHFEGTALGKPWHFLNRSPHRLLYYRHLRSSGWPRTLPDGLTLRNIAHRYLPSALKARLRRMFPGLRAARSDLDVI